MSIDDDRCCKDDPSVPLQEIVDTCISCTTLYVVIIQLSRDFDSPRLLEIDFEQANARTTEWLQERGIESSPRFGDRGSVLSASLKRVRSGSSREQHLNHNIFAVAYHIDLSQSRSTWHLCSPCSVSWAF
jgi:hypothetical protein